MATTKLYHSSSDRHSVLKPTMGARRGSHEPKEIKGKPCVWLSDQPLLGPHYKYVHTVNVDEGDPDLHSDKGMDATSGSFERIFGGRAPRFYYYSAELQVDDVAEL